MVAVLAHDRDPVLRDENLLGVRARRTRIGTAALAPVRQRVERGLDGGEVAGPVLRDDDVRTFAGMGGARRLCDCCCRQGQRCAEQDCGRDAETVAAGARKTYRLAAAGRRKAAKFR